MNTANFAPKLPLSTVSASVTRQGANGQTFFCTPHGLPFERVIVQGFVRNFKAKNKVFYIREHKGASEIRVTGKYVEGIDALASPEGAYVEVMGKLSPPKSDANATPQAPSITAYKVFKLSKDVPVIAALWDEELAFLDQHVYPKLVSSVGNKL